MSKITLVSAVNAAFAVFGLVNIVIGTVFLAIERTGSGGAALTFGLLMLLAATVDRFEVLRGLGIEAKTRELKETIDLADEVIAKFRPLTELTCASLIRLDAQEGRFGYGMVPAGEAYRRASVIREIMQMVGMDESSTRAVLLPWAVASAGDVCASISVKYIAALNNVLQATADEKARFDQRAYPDDAERARLTARLQAVTDYIGKVDGHMRCHRLPDLIKGMKALQLDIPDYVPEKERAWLLSELAAWIPEMLHLNDSMKLQTPKRWIERINSYNNIEEQSFGT